MSGVKIYVLLADRGTQNPHNGTLSLLNVGWAVTQLRRPMGAPAGRWGSALAHRPPGRGGVDRGRAGHVQPEPDPGDRTADRGWGRGRNPEPRGPGAVRLELMVPSPSGVPTGFPGRATAMMELPTGLPLSPGIYRSPGSTARRRTTGRPISTWRRALGTHLRLPPGARVTACRARYARPRLSGFQMGAGDSGGRGRRGPGRIPGSSAPLADVSPAAVAGGSS